MNVQVFLQCFIYIENNRGDDVIFDPHHCFVLKGKCVLAPGIGLFQIIMNPPYRGHWNSRLFFPPIFQWNSRLFLTHVLGIPDFFHNLDRSPIEDIGIPDFFEVFKV